MNPRPTKKASSTDPLYRQLSNTLRDEIFGEGFQDDERFHSISTLIKQHNMSLTTVRAALDLLQREGLLEARHGSGYYVQKTRKSIKASASSHYLALMPAFASLDESWFTGRLLAGMSAEASKRGAVLSVCHRSYEDCYFSSNNTEDILQKIMDYSPDGVIWHHAYPHSLVPLVRLVERGVPVITTMRQFRELPLPFVGEDDQDYSKQIVTRLQQHGHQSLGVLVSNQGDDYYDRKFEALKEAGESCGVRVSRDLSMNMVTLSDEEKKEKLETFLDTNPDLSALLVLASYEFRFVRELFEGRLAERMKEMTLIYNVLDGVTIPRLPTGETITTIEPPLEVMGARLIQTLARESGDEGEVSTQPLISKMVMGDSLRPAGQWNKKANTQTPVNA